MDEGVPAPLEKKTTTNIYQNENNPQPNSHAKAQQTPYNFKQIISSFRSVIKYLKEYNVDFYIYQLKDENAYRIMIQNFHQSTKIEFIKEELGKNGHLASLVKNTFEKVLKY
jgi:hypothetical protein